MSPRLSETAHVGGVRLQVGELDRSLAFYRDLLGFVELTRDSSEATLGAPEGKRALVTLSERPGAKPVGGRSRLGLFHFAILLPDRAALGSVMRHLSNQGVRLGMSDHLVSEALYLSDPDGLGIEIYRDRPRAEWRHHGGELAMSTDPLDVDDLARAPGVAPWTGMPAGTTIGHMHLHVDDLERAEAFYHGVIGFDITVRRYPGALFMSAGGYHHHLGVNTWARGAPAPAADDAQLVHWDLVVADAAEVAAVASRLDSSGARVVREGAALHARDPAGTTVRVVPE